MQARTIFRVLKWAYYGTLLVATGVGTWAAVPYVKQQRSDRAAALTVNVYSHAFIPVFKDTPLRAVSVGNFFSQDVIKDAIAALMASQPAPLAKGADAEAWQRELVSGLTASLNDHMARRYSDALQRVQVSNAASGVVLVRIENVSAAPVEEIRLEVAGAQLFMEGPAAGPKLRSLGTRAMRVGVLQPGDKTELFAMTTQDMSPGANAPAVKVSSKELQFPVVQHPQNAPLRPTAQEAGWIAFGAFYLALILAGLGVKVFSLMGVRFALVTPEKATPPFTAAPPVAVVPAAPLTATAQAAWQRPKVS